MEVYVDDEAKLTLHGLQQHYVKLNENEKNKKLFELLDILEFNQVRVIFHLSLKLLQIRNFSTNIYQLKENGLKAEIHFHMTTASINSELISVIKYKSLVAIVVL